MALTLFSIGGLLALPNGGDAFGGDITNLGDLSRAGYWTLTMTGLNALEFIERDAHLRVSGQSNNGLDLQTGRGLGVRWRAGNYAGTVGTRLYEPSAGTVGIDDGAGGAAHLAVTGHVGASEYRDAGGLHVVVNRQAAISDPAGGGTVDVEARAAIAAILTMLRPAAHGLISD